LARCGSASSSAESVAVAVAECATGGRSSIITTRGLDGEKKATTKKQDESKARVRGQAKNNKQTNNKQKKTQKLRS
jgi:hypothetical protein